MAEPCPGDPPSTIQLPPGASQGPAPHPADTTVSGVFRSEPTDPFRSGTSPTAITNGPQAWPVVQGYDILAELGRGGMGVVYQAKHLQLNRLVALKMILSGEHAGPQELARFRTEAEAVARLQHPNIVQIYEVGEQNGRPFFALEFLDGGNLAEQIAGVPWQPQAAAAMAEKLARAMHAAHERGIVHRDLKPANVLLAKDGTPKVTDFGLAKRTDGEALASGGPSPVTLTGSILGTPSYMAPEQASGVTKRILPAVDIYALGAMLYELLTGRPPFRAATPMDTMMLVLSQEPVSPRRLQPAVPRDLETICLKCLEKSPKKRYASAEALANDLRCFLEKRPIAARPVRRWERIVKWARRRPTDAALVAVTGLAALVFIVSWAVFTARLGDALDDVQKQRDAAVEQRARAEKSEQETKVALEESRQAQVGLHLANGRRPLETGDLAGLVAALPSFAEALRLDREPAGAARVPVHRLRLGMILQQCPRLLRVWPHDQEVAAADLSPDGRRLVVAGGDGSVRIYDTADEGALRLEQAGEVNVVVFSPDSRRILTAGADGTARVWDAVSGAAITSSLSHDGAVLDAAFSPDGRWIVTAGGDVVRIWDAASGNERFAPLRHESTVAHAGFSTDGTLVLMLAEDGTARRWDAATGKPAGPALPRGVKATFSAFSPDGRRLATAAEQVVQLWDPASGQPVAEPITPTASVVSLVFSPDGRRLVVVAQDGMISTWDATTGSHINQYLVDGARAALFSPDGHRLLNLGADRAVWVREPLTFREQLMPLRHSDTVVTVRFDRDGRRLATVTRDGLVWLWDTAPTPAAPVLRQNARLAAAAFSPDGRRVLTAGEDWTARVWDPRTGREVVPPLRHDDAVLFAAFSPDGRWVVTTSKDRTARLWDAATGKEAVPPLRHSDVVQRAAFSSDGRLLVTASADHTARVWDVATGQEAVPPLLHGDAVSQAAFSPDGKQVVTACADGKVRIWDAATGARVGPVLDHEAPVLDAAFSPDGKQVATACTDGKARLWDVAAGKELYGLKHGDQVNLVAFSPEGNRIVTASNDGTARIWDPEKGIRIVLKHGGANGPVGTGVAGGQMICAAFSPDGRWVVTGGTDLVACVWDAATGAQVSPSLQHQGTVSAVAFSADGRQLLTASEDSLARVWELSSDEHTVDDLVLLAQVLAGHRIDRTGMTTPLEPAELTEDLQKLRSRRPDDFSLTPEALQAWHRRQADECEAAQDWAAAQFHLDRLLADGDDEHLRRRRDRAVCRRQTELGNAAAQVNRWADALEAYTRALALAPEDWSAWYNHGRALAGLGMLDPSQGAMAPGLGVPPVTAAICLSGALDDYDRALVLAPREGAVWLAKNLVLVRLGRKDAAATAYVRAEELSGAVILAPDRRWDRRGRGVAPLDRDPWQALNADLAHRKEAHREDAGDLRALGLSTGALGLLSFMKDPFELAARHDAGDWRARRGLARGLAEAKEWEKSADECSAILALEPGAWDLWYLRGVAREALGRPKEAATDYTRALALKPDAWAVRLARGHAHLLARQWTEAVADCTEALKARPDDVSTLKDRAQAFSGLRDWPRAVADATAALRLRPEDAEVSGRRGHAYCMLGKLDEALADFDRALELRADVWSYWSGHGDIRAQQQDWDRASRDYSRATSLAPPDEVRVWLKQGVVQLELDNPAGYRDVCARLLGRIDGVKDQEAKLDTVWACVAVPDAAADLAAVLQLAEKLVADDPKSGAALRVLGAALYRTGQYGPALERLNEAVKREQDVPEAWLFLALAHKRGGHADEARRCLEKADELMKRSSAAAAWDHDPPCGRLRREAGDLLGRPSKH